MDEIVGGPVQLEKTVRDFEETILESGKGQKISQIVGIVGPGGSGKTTLAKELYTRKCSMMKGSSFLSHVRSSAAENALIHLQKKLLGDLLPNSLVKDLPFCSINDGKIIVESRLKSVRALLVLDDVDHVDQLDALLTAKENIACGSLIIVTTRNSNVLTSWGISTSSIYQMQGLEPLHAKYLLCGHPIPGSIPWDELKRLVDMFVSVYDGLPLTLKLLGQLLQGSSEESWCSQSFKSPIDIRETLELNFRKLSEEEQEMFFDIACFFIGEEISLAIAVWVGLGWNIKSWDTLMNKCLVELDEKKRIRMHDELRDFGRDLAISISPYRIWSPKQIVNIKKQARDTMTIRGIIAAASQFVVCSAHEEFPTYSDYYQPPFEDCMKLIEKSSRSLKALPTSTQKSLIKKSSPSLTLHPSKSLLYFLVIKGNDFTDKYATLSEHLIWLRWFDFHYPSLPPWLSVKNLRVLELYGALSLKELWKDNANVPLELRELIISSSWGSRFEMFPPSISKLKHLRKIALIGYIGGEFHIQGLPEEFCQLKSLEHLELRHCKALSSLPTCFGNLTSLQHLDLRSCEALNTLPLSFRDLINLQYLDLSGCRRLAFRSDMLEDMKRLENLYLSGCLKLQELPNIKNQACLKQLHLQDTNLLDIPRNIDQLSKLQVLTIGSPLLLRLPDSFGHLSSLNSLSIIDCIDLEALPPSLEHLNLLEYFHIEFSRVKSLKIWQFSNLKTLKIFDCPISELDFGQGHSMKRLKLINVGQTLLTRISISQDCCPELEILQLEQNDELEKIGTLPTTVKIIELSDCELLHDISGIDLVNLQIFEKSGCPLLDKL